MTGFFDMDRMLILFLKQFVGTVSCGLHHVSRQYNEDIMDICRHAFSCTLS